MGRMRWRRRGQTDSGAADEEWEGVKGWGGGAACTGSGNAAAAACCQPSPLPAAFPERLCIVSVPSANQYRRRAVSHRCCAAGRLCALSPSLRRAPRTPELLIKPRPMDQLSHRPPVHFTVMQSVPLRSLHTTFYYLFSCFE